MPLFLFALLAHGVIGALDVLINHEWLARLPATRGAATEQRLHSGRELIFATLFAGLAWFEWHGVLMLAIVALYGAELCISVVDTVVEFDTRRLPLSERILHVFLFVNLGVMMALLGPYLAAWWGKPTGLMPVSYGPLSWLLSGLAVVALGWSIRDGLSVRRTA